MHPFFLYLRKAILGALLGLVFGFIAGGVLTIALAGDAVLPGDNFMVFIYMMNGAFIGASIGLFVGLFLAYRTVMQANQNTPAPPTDPDTNV